MHRFKARFLIFVLTSLNLPFVAQARGTAQPYVVLGPELEAPRGFVEMCHYDNTFCSSPSSINDGDARLITAALTADRSAYAGATKTREIAASKGPFQRQSFYDKESADAAWPSASLNLAASVRLGTARAAPLLFGAQPRSNSVTWNRTAQSVNEPARMLASIDTSADVSMPAPVPIPGPTGLLEFHLASDLERINHFVNARVAQRTDLQVYGRAEVWHRSGVGRGAAGDCEDIAIEKRFELLQAGYPKDHLAFAVVYEHSVGLHTVLIARTDQGDYVLDSRTPYVKRWDTTPYNFVAVQSMQSPMHWFAPGSAATMMAVRAETTSPTAS